MPRPPTTIATRGPLTSSRALTAANTSSGRVPSTEVRGSMPWRERSVTLVSGLTVEPTGASSTSRTTTSLRSPLLPSMTVMVRAGPGAPAICFGGAAAVCVGAPMTATAYGSPPSGSLITTTQATAKATMTVSTPTAMPSTRTGISEGCFCGPRPRGLSRSSATSSPVGESGAILPRRNQKPRPEGPDGADVGERPFGSVRHGPRVGREGRVLLHPAQQVERKLQLLVVLGVRRNVSRGARLFLGVLLHRLQVAAQRGFAAGFHLALEVIGQVL